MRIMLEAESYPGKTFFITLTYDKDNIADNVLDHSDWAQFMKNFRQKFCQAKYCNIRDRGTLRHGKEYSHTFKKVRQVMSGEYGDEFGRRHFHGIIFNHDFDDIRVLKTPDGIPVYSKKGNLIRTSDSLRDVWKKGNVQVEEVTFDLALYVGSYITDGDLDLPDGVKKQYGRFGSGIGVSWISRYWKDVLSAGKVMLRDRDFPTPRYFHDWMKLHKNADYQRYFEKKLLQTLKKNKRIIAKGDGPLRRAQAKGRILEQIHKKRKVDNAIWENQRRGSNW